MILNLSVVDIVIVWASMASPVFLVLWYIWWTTEDVMIQPTVGRVVWFYPRGSKPSDQPHVALIAHVWSDTCVNLAIFDANGQPYPPGHTSILLVQDDAEVPSGGNYCTWMPFQKGQAQKAEALEKQLAQK